MQDLAILKLFDHGETERERERERRAIPIGARAPKKIPISVSFSEQPVFLLLCYCPWPKLRK